MSESQRDAGRGQGGDQDRPGRRVPVRQAFSTPVPPPSSPAPFPVPPPPSGPYGPAAYPVAGTAPPAPPPTYSTLPPHPPAYGYPPAAAWGYPQGAWAPRADVYREDGDYIIITDVPGIDLDTLDLTWDGGELVLEAAIRSPEKPERQPLLRERPTGTYYRRIPLGPDLDPAGAVASYCDGILEVRVPRKRRRPGKTVRVTRGGPQPGPRG